MSYSVLLQQLSKHHGKLMIRNAINAWLLFRYSIFLDFIVDCKGVIGIPEQCRSEMNFDFGLCFLGYFERVPIIKRVKSDTTFKP